jgi:glycosyltransferase involved in cell wall biosynthesis
MMIYLTRRLQTHMPDLEISVHKTRLTERPLLKHLSIPLSLAAFTFECLRRRIDIVHINVAPRGSTWRKMLYQAVAIALGKRVIIHLHGSGYDGFFDTLSPQRKKVVRAFFGRATVVVALSSYWKQFVVSELGLPPSKVVEIPNGVPAVSGERARSTVAAAPLIVFLGEVSHRKGIDVLIDALAHLSGNGTPWTAAVGGNGDVAAAVARAREAGIGDQIDFLGWVGEAKVDELLRSADIFVLPSRAENQPVAILEAMARSTPVVATNVGAIPEQVVDGETGLLVEPGSSDSLAQALETLLRSPELRARFGSSGLRRFEERFSVASCAERFAALYRSM